MGVWSPDLPIYVKLKYEMLILKLENKMYTRYTILLLKNSHILVHDFSSFKWDNRFAVD